MLFSFHEAYQYGLQITDMRTDKKNKSQMQAQQCIPGILVLGSVSRRIQALSLWFPMSSIPHKMVRVSIKYWSIKNKYPETDSGVQTEDQNIKAARP